MDCIQHSQPKPAARTLLALIGVCGISLNPLWGQDESAAVLERPAHFRVTDTVINADVPAFTATIGTIGNSLYRFISGYEPVNWRYQWFTNADAQGSLVFDDSLARHNALADGLLNGGFVRVYRVVDGAIQLVLEDTIPEDDGFMLRDWFEPDMRKLIPASSHEYFHKWANWEDGDHEYWFAVAAVDSAGTLSEPSNAVGIVPPSNHGKAPNPKNPKTRIRGDGNGDAPPQPQNLRYEILDNGLAHLTWDPVEGAAAYAVLYSNHDPASHDGFLIRLSNTDFESKAGDMVIAGKRMTRFTSNMKSPRLRYESRSNKDLFGGTVRMLGLQDQQEPGVSWHYREHPADTPVSDAGETYLEVSLEAASGPYYLGEYVHAGTEQEYREVLHPTDYTIDFWMRQNNSDPVAVAVAIEGYDLAPVPVNVTNEWQHFTCTFTIPEIMTGDRPWRAHVMLEEPGTYSVDNLRFYRSDIAFLDYSPVEYQRLAESGMSHLRTHGPIKTGMSTYSMDQFLNPGGVVSGIGFGNTLPQTLRIIDNAGVEPWLQIEYHMSPQEWLAWVEYMAAPFDPSRDSAEELPYAAKRYYQGRQQPWIDAFDSIYFELSNETWNRLFKPWTFGSMPDSVTGEMINRGAVYGMFQEHVIDILRSSPHWTPALDDKFTFIIGGWREFDYGFQAGAHSPRSKFITNAAYNGGWDEGEGPAQPNPTSFFNLMAQVNQTAIPRAITNNGQLQEVNALRQNPAVLGVYEAGPGYAGVVHTKESEEVMFQQELIMKSLAAGTATLDSFLARAAHGYRLDNFFTLGEGQTWSSHAEWYRGGQAYPQWQALSLFNNHGTGSMLAVETLDVPTADLQGTRRRETVDDAPLAAAYATRHGDRLTLVLINRQIPDYPVAGIDGTTPFTVELPISAAKRIRMLSMSGDYRDENFTGEHVHTVEQELPTDHFTGRLTVEVPPAHWQMYVFAGVQ